MDQPRRVDPTSGPSPFGDVDSDAELLKAFAAATPGSASAQAVLTQIVARHGTMVYQVAQRMVCDPTLVDDVFQATFLVLAQSARKIQKSASLASWLHGTARNIGRRALNDKYGVRSQTTTGVEMVTAVEDDPFTEMIRSHERQLLDEELQQLPEIYRAPLVLHYFEERSNQEISQWLGVTVAAVESRLKRAKQLLRARLVRRGMTLSVAVAALGASSSLATATPSVALVSSTITLAATTPAITASLTTVAASAVLQLAGKELATMSAASKITALLLTTAGTLTLGGAVLFGAAYGGLTGEGPKTGQRANGIDPVITDEPEFNALEQIHEPVLLASGENTPKTTVEGSSDALKTALKREVQFDIPETTLKEALEKLSDECGVTFVVPHPEELGASLNSRVKLVANGAPLGSVLEEMLANVDGKKLRYGIVQGALAIDSADNLGGTTTFMERMQYDSGKGWKTLPPQAKRFSAAVSEALPKASADANQTTPHTDSADFAEKVKRDTQKIRDALDQVTTFEFKETPLKEAIASMSEKCGISIKLDTQSLKDAGINEDTPIDLVVEGITLRSSLKLMLENVDGKALDYLPEHGVLVVGTAERIQIGKAQNTSNIVRSESKSPTADKAQLPSTQDSTTVITGNNIQITTKRTQPDVKGAPQGNGASLLGDTGSEHRAPIVSAIRNLTAADRRVYQALDQTTRLEFPDNPIQEVFDFVAELHDIRIRFDRRSLEDEGVNLESRVKCVIGDVSLRTALPLILDSAEGVKLDYYVDGGILFITTEDAVNHKKSLRFYDLSSELVNLPEVIEECAENFEASEPGTLELTSFGDCLAIETSFAIHKKLEEMIVGILQVAEARKAAGKEFFIPEPKPALTRPAPVQPAPSTGEQQQPAGAVGGYGTTGTAPAGNPGGGFIGGGSGGFN